MEIAKPTRWLNILEAAKYVEHLFGAESAATILRRARNGDISVTARKWVYIPPDDLETYNLLNDNALHAESAKHDFLALLYDLECGTSSWASLSTSCHITGDYEIGHYQPVQPPNGWHSVIGLRFNEQDLIGSFDLQGATAILEVSHADYVPNVRASRSLSHHHAYAAAMVTLELIKLDPDDFRNSTLASVAAMLEPHYRATHRKKSVPDADTMKECAREILEALKYSKKQS